MLKPNDMSSADLYYLTTRIYLFICISNVAIAIRKKTTKNCKYTYSDITRSKIVLNYTKNDKKIQLELL